MILTKNKKNSFTFIAIFFCVHLGFSQNNKQVSSIYFFTFKTDSTKTFDAVKFSNSIKNQLKKYNLTIYKSDEIRRGKMIFTSKYLGKSFFKDTYKVYENDLNKYLPKLPDFTRNYFRNNQLIRN